jgi:hypothetical protein
MHYVGCPPTTSVEKEEEKHETDEEEQLSEFPSCSLEPTNERRCFIFGHNNRPIDDRAWLTVEWPLAQP